MCSRKEVSVRDFISSNRSFSVAVYKGVLQHHTGNLLISSLTTQTALALTLFGSKNETYSEIRNTLHFPNDQDRIEAAIRKFLPRLEDDSYTLYTAIKLYIKNEFSIKKEFSKIANELFLADIENINFSQREETAEAMNKWVEEKTNHKVQKLVSSNDLNDLTTTILINALYFKADWKFKFHLIDTKKIDFYINAKDTVKIDAMQYFPCYMTYFKYCWNEDLNARFLQLPFKDADASMVLILPEKREGLDDLEKQIEKVLVSPKFRSENLTILLPKFKINTHIDIKEILQNLGIYKAFERGGADLSGIAGKKGDIFIDKIVQKSFVEVNEEGVTAAAAEWHLVPVYVCNRIGEPPPSFIADHPFMFYIKIKGVIAFVGRVTNPLM